MQRSGGAGVNEMKTDKAPQHSDALLESIAASVVHGTQVMVEICQRVLDGFVMPVGWAITIMATIFKRKGDIRNYSCHSHETS